MPRRVEAGASSPAETGRAEVASALVKADRERFKATLASARRELAVLMGDAAPKFGEVSGRLDTMGRPPTFQSVVAAKQALRRLRRLIEKALDRTQQPPSRRRAYVRESDDSE